MKHLKLWEIRSNFKLYEVALLMLGYDVDKYAANTENLLSDQVSGFRALYGQILEDACSKLGDEPSHENPEVEIPIYRLRTDKPESAEKLNFKDGLEVSAYRSDVINWIKRHNDYWGNPDVIDLAKKNNMNWSSPLPDKFFINEHADIDRDDDLSLKERQTLLIIIAAIAKEAKLDVSKTYKTADLISNMTQLMGCKLNRNTIVNHLKLIPDAIERRAK